MWVGCHKIRLSTYGRSVDQSDPTSKPRVTTTRHPWWWTETSSCRCTGSMSSRTTARMSTTWDWSSSWTRCSGRSCMTILAESNRNLCDRYGCIWKPSLCDSPGHDHEGEDRLSIKNACQVLMMLGLRQGTSTRMTSSLKIWGTPRAWGGGLIFRGGFRKKWIVLRIAWNGEKIDQNIFKFFDPSQTLFPNLKENQTIFETIDIVLWQGRTAKHKADRF